MRWGICRARRLLVRMGFFLGEGRCLGKAGWGAVS